MNTAGSDRHSVSAGAVAPWRFGNPPAAAPNATAHDYFKLTLVFVCAVLFVAALVNMRAAVEVALRPSFVVGFPSAPELPVYLGIGADGSVSCVTSKELRIMAQILEPLMERVHGVYSLPAGILSNFRFALTDDGSLILRCIDAAGEWRNAHIDDLKPPVIDMIARRRDAVYRAHLVGAHMSVRQAIRMQPATPAAITWNQMPNDHAARVSVMANFFVTDGKPSPRTMPLIDLIDAKGDPMLAIALRLGRRGQI